MYSKNNQNYKVVIKNSTTFKNMDIIINSKKYVLIIIVFNLEINKSTGLIGNGKINSKSFEK